MNKPFSTGMGLSTVSSNVPGVTLTGYRMRIYGLTFSVLPAAVVTGPASLSIGNVVDGTQYGAEGAINGGGVGWWFTPSTTTVYTRDVYFNAGVETFATEDYSYPIFFTVQATGTDTFDVNVGYWGELIPVS